MVPFAHLMSTITTKKLGDLLQHWGETDKDPVHAVGSLLAAGKTVDEEQVKKTRIKIQKLLRSAQSGSHGWGQTEVEELKTINDGLAGLLRVYPFGEMPTLDDFRTHLTSGKDAQGRRYISSTRPLLHFDLEGNTGQQALAAANKADDNRATAGKGRSAITASQTGDAVAIAVNDIGSLYDWIVALTQSGSDGSKLAKVIMEDLGYSWVGASQNPSRSARKFVVHMDNMGDEGTVTVHVQGPGALAWAKDEQTIGGSSWESADGPDFAYTVLYDNPGLVAELKEEGYKLDQTEYSPPDAEENPAKKPMSMREAQKERAKGATWFRGLRREQKFELGDAFVLDTFDWRDWMDDKPSNAFLNGADEARINWEIMSNPTGGLFVVGSRVQLHPGTDLWMRGDRYGEVVKSTKTRVQVKLDKSRRTVWLQNRNVMPIEENPRRKAVWSTAYSLTDPNLFDVVNKETGERKVLDETMGVAQQVEDTLNGRGDPTSEVYEWASQMNPTAFEKAKFKSLRDRWADGEVKVVTWFERDRAMIGIQEVATGEYLVDWWDDEVGELIDDGFIKSGRAMENSVIDYAEEIEIPAYYHAKKKGGSKERKGNPARGKKASEPKITKAMMADAVKLWRAGADPHKDGEDFEAEILNDHVFLTGTVYDGRRVTQQIGWDKKGPYVWNGDKFRFYDSERRPAGDLVIDRTSR